MAIYRNFYLENCLKMDVQLQQLFFLAKSVFVAVAEWSKASDHFLRSFGQNLRWGPGSNFFFLFFYVFGQFRMRKSRNFRLYSNMKVNSSEI